ncbi:hypothetical protein V5799_030706 [Amblyomma americanum]|uniref:SCP domain-containing protein n=1 Tax=Amblyomma americanum TaxID=6943 RepID=A0AAQ4EML5_AMBAM
MLEKWFKAKEKFDVANLEKYVDIPDRGVQRFVQLIWAKTIYVGCAYVKFLQPSQPSAGSQEILVCNYSPGGRKTDQPVYLKGEPCTQCGDRSCHDTTLLCKGDNIVPREQSTGEDGSELAAFGIIAAVIALVAAIAGLVSMHRAASDAATIAGAAGAAGPEVAAGGAEGFPLSGVAGDEIAAASPNGGAGDKSGEGATKEGTKEGSKESHKSDIPEDAGSQEAIISKAD